MKRSAARLAIAVGALSLGACAVVPTDEVYVEGAYVGAPVYVESYPVYVGPRPLILPPPPVYVRPGPVYVHPSRPAWPRYDPRYDRHYDPRYGAPPRHGSYPRNQVAPTPPQGFTGPPRSGRIEPEQRPGPGFRGYGAAPADPRPRPDVAPNRVLRPDVAPNRSARPDPGESRGARPQAGGQGERPSRADRPWRSD